MKFKKSHKITLIVISVFLTMIYIIRHRVTYDFNSRLSNIKCEVHSKEALLLKEDIITNYKKWLSVLYYEIHYNLDFKNNDEYIKYCKNRGITVLSKTQIQILKEYKIKDKKEQEIIKKYLINCTRLIFDMNDKYIDFEIEDKNFVSKYLFL